MHTPPQRLVFASLAMNQTVFYKALGDELARRGIEPVYVCFHERSHEWLLAQGARSYNPFAMQPTDPGQVDLGAEVGDQLSLLLSHEKAAYEISDSARLLDKLRNHLHAMRQILAEVLSEPGQVELVQELGGFLSVLAAHFAARERSLNSWFIEPSFFRGRVFFVRNGFSAVAVGGPHAVRLEPEVAEYLRQATAQQATVIPLKDKHHYRTVSMKLTDARNIRRLVEKLRDKYLLRKQEEFQYVGGHVRRHLRMWLNHQRQRRHYRSLPEAGRFVYYPLHVPADVALTIRSPEYLDQFALIDFLCRATPHGHKLAIKEHPALIGAAPYARLRDLLARHDNLVLLRPELNNYEVLRASDAVVTVNSKSGAEALLLGKPVLVLGDAFYSSCSLVRRVTGPAELPAQLREMLRATGGPEADAVGRYFQDVWSHSCSGELYDTRPENVTRFADSLLQRLSH